jgi:hypothetical protein
MALIVNTLYPVASLSVHHCQVLGKGLPFFAVFVIIINLNLNHIFLQVEHLIFKILESWNMEYGGWTSKF